ncbi:MAG: lysophospholipid acyltransferase family protein [Dehalococcoidia bacterium]
MQRSPRHFIYHLTRFFALPFFRILFSLLTRYRVTGQDNVPPDGPLLIVANHISSADQYLMYFTIKRKMMFMAKEELFRSPLIRILARCFGAFPVYRKGINRRALNEASRALDSGFALAMFPEGARSKTAQLRPAMPGSALIALDKNLTILPVGIAGVEAREKGILWSVFNRPRIAVNIGRPFTLPATSQTPTKQELAELSDLIMEHIARLLPPEYRGYYAAKTKSH